MKVSSAYSLLLVILFLQSVRSLKLTTDLSPNTNRCFYEILNYNQKYRIDITPKISPSSTDRYSVKIDYLSDPQQEIWTNLFLKEQISTLQSTNVHKLSDFQTTYRVCIRNPNPSLSLKYQLNIATGLELMELHLLPENSDAENIMAEIEFLQKEKQVLIESLKYADSIKSETYALSSIVNSSTLNGVLIFTIVALCVNGAVYWKASKSLRARKSI